MAVGTLSDKPSKMLRLIGSSYIKDIGAATLDDLMYGDPGSWGVLEQPFPLRSPAHPGGYSPEDVKELPAYLK